MRKPIKIALYVLGMIGIVIGSAAIGFWEGMHVGAETAFGIANVNDANNALSQIKASMTALNSDDPNVLRNKIVIQLHKSLVDLGTLSKTLNFALCTEQDRHALADAAHYVAAHPDETRPDTGSFLKDGIGYCDGRPNVSVSFMTTGKE
jgi:hypothetical protein